MGGGRVREQKEGLPEEEKRGRRRTSREEGELDFLWMVLS